MPRAVAFAALVLASAVAVGQAPIDRRSREQPEVVPRAGDGRHGSCDALRFTPAGDVLFAAGDDKVLTGWRHADAGLLTDPATTEVLRWPAWREQIGGVKSFDLTADGKRVLVGGFGLRPSNVATLERNRLDGATKQLVTWPFARPGKERIGTVTTVAFSPDGKSAAFGTQDGSLWLWHPEELKKPDDAGRWCNVPLWVGAKLLAELKMPSGELRKIYDWPKLVFYRAEGKTLIAVGQTGSVTEYDIADPKALGKIQHAKPAPTKLLFNVNDGEDRFDVWHVAYDAPRDRLIVASDATNHVLVRDLNGKPATVLTLPHNHFARTLAVHPKTGAIAVAVATIVPAKGKHAQFHNDANDELYLYSDTAKKLVPDQKLPFAGQADVLAFHPTLNRLAVAGGDASEVTLFDLAAPNKPLTVVKGSGRRVWELALATDGSAVGMRTKRDAAADLPNGRGAGEWSWMNLAKLIPSPVAPKEWVTANPTADGWTVEPDKRNRDRWYAVHPTGARLALKYNSYVFNKPTCFTFLKRTQAAPTRLILGHYYGASLFELPAPTTPPGDLQPARVYIGHSGEVLSVAAVDDAKGGWFVTGGADHTLAAFHLPGWKNNANLGVSFETVGQPGKLVAAAVATGSPGWEAGLQAGDEVLLLAVGFNRVYDARPAAKVAVPEEGTPYETDERPAVLPALNAPADLAAALKVLTAAAPARGLYFRVRTKGGATRDVTTSVKQRPLWKLYPTFTPDDKPAEWVAWMWKGSYYQTASPNGDELVGWHLNGPTPNLAPRFHPLSHYKGYQRNELVRALVRDRDLAAALDKIAKDPTRPTARLGSSESAPVRLALDGLEIVKKPLTARVTVARRGSDVDLLPERVELWVNDYRYRVWEHDPLKPFDSGDLELDPAVFRSEDKGKVPFGDNVLTVRTYNRAGGRETATRVVTNRNEPPLPHLLGVAAGVDDYKVHRVVSGARGLVGDLKYAVADASLVSKSFDAHVGAKRYFLGGNLGLEKDAAVVRKKLLADLAALKKAAKPNDLLVLFLAGHGQLIGHKGIRTEVIADTIIDPEKVYDRVQFAFCCPTFATDKPGDAIITADELYTELVGINCRKMVVLDVCRSGWAARTDVVREFVPNGLGPFVLAACGPGQKSYESDDLKHGLFTAALTEALTVGAAENAAFAVADTDRDGKLSCQELFDYVRKRVTEERQDQTPTCFPDRARLPRTVVVSAKR